MKSRKYYGLVTNSVHGMPLGPNKYLTFSLPSLRKACREHALENYETVHLFDSDRELCMYKDISTHITSVDDFIEWVKTTWKGQA